MRMGMRRFTRLTNAFSKKVENLTHAVSLHYMNYNFARPHQTLTKANGGKKTTPAMAAGIENRVWITATSPRCGLLEELLSCRFIAVLQCAYDQQPAVLAHLACRRSGSDDPAAVFALYVSAGLDGGEFHRQLV